jgi:hypothetical protein
VTKPKRWDDAGARARMARALRVARRDSLMTVVDRITDALRYGVERSDPPVLAETIARTACDLTEKAQSND